MIYHFLKQILGFFIRETLIHEELFFLHDVQSLLVTMNISRNK